MEDPPGIVITDVFNCIEICIFFFSFLPRVNDYQYHLSIVLVLYFSLFLGHCLRSRMGFKRDCLQEQNRAGHL